MSDIVVISGRSEDAGPPTFPQATILTIVHHGEDKVVMRLSVDYKVSPTGRLECEYAPDLILRV